MKDEDFNQFVIDSSFILAYIMPDEDNARVTSFMQRHEESPFPLYAPTLLFFELANALKSAIKRKRISAKDGKTLLSAARELNIIISEVDYDAVMNEAILKDISAYDASYVTLAKEMNIKLLTLDQKLAKLA